MHNVCRTCMGESPMVNIFSDVIDPALEQPERNLSYILSECTNRSVRKDDSQPQFICLACLQAAQTAFRFKLQCDRSYHHFCELQNKESLDGDQNGDNQQAGHKEAPTAEEFRSHLSPAKRVGTNVRQKMLSPSGERKRKRNIYYVEDNRFECHLCPNNYKNRHGLKRHLLTHSSKPIYKCPSCLKAFWRKDSYIGHLLLHGIRSPVSCKQCPTICADATQLEIHQREHNGETVAEKCPVPDDLNLEANNVNINKENSVDVIEKNLPLLENVHKNLCDHCSDSFILEDDLKIHTMLVHDLNISDSPEKSKVLDLEPKRLDFSQEGNTNKDLSVETSDDPTSRHDESEFDQNNISGQDTQPHSKFLIKSSSSEGKPFKCATCQRSYKSKKSMLDHQATHLSSPKHHCSICSKAFWLRYKLKRHMRTHEDEGPHPCRQCSAIFIDRIQLKIHQRDHEGKTSEDSESEGNDVNKDDNNINMINDSGILNHVNDTNPTTKSTTILRGLDPDLYLSSESSTIGDSSTLRSKNNQSSRQNESGFDQDTTSSGQAE
ncbi:uncharacterized zinc finger protein CG2678 isoform X2 [Drosophila serrata]|nr:uncharacterized zinc finger protein CG2678 isoform X2 [Drosophila serrata]